MKKSFVLTLPAAIVLGVCVAFIDTRPHWDDNGISVLILLIVSFICGSLTSQKTWLIALAIGIWTPLFNIFLTNNFGSLIALIPAFVGSYAGVSFRKIFSKL